jgi:hypothetical protein
MMIFIFEDKIACFILQYLENLPDLELSVLATLHKHRCAIDGSTRCLDLFAHLLHPFALPLVALVPLPHRRHEGISLQKFHALNAEEPDAHHRHVREPAVSLQEPGMSLCGRGCTHALPIMETRNSALVRCARDLIHHAMYQRSVLARPYDGRLAGAISTSLAEFQHIFPDHGPAAYIPHFDLTLFAFPAPGWRGTSGLLGWTVDGGRYRKQLEYLRLHWR